jgi:hypothetical protein
MAFTSADRVKTTTTTTGTGTLTISTTAPTGFQNATAIGDGNSAPWCQIATSGEWQTFIGTVGASGTTLTKDIILDGSSGPGVAVSFPAGTHDVFCTLSADLVGYTQIGTTQTPSGVASSSITSIPAVYSDLLLEILGLSHDSGSNQQIRLELTPDNGGTWVGPVSFGGLLAASATSYGNFVIPGYRRGAIVAQHQSASLTANNTAGTGGGTAAPFRISAGVNGVRLSWGGGNFDAGSWKLWGKL